MYDVLVYVYENYFTPATCPKPEDLAARLIAAGFEHHDIHDAMSWLHRLAVNTESLKKADQPEIPLNATRIYGAYEQYKLGINGVSFLYSMESSGVLTPIMREAVVNCALDAPQETLTLSEFKILALMVLWSQELEIHDSLLDELILHGDDEQMIH
ncbi:MAG: DUF494 domain-containing protein [Alcaligenaceae bacterium]|jgi:Smg protein|nr:DUF494 domain-containing protein [Alcaligenaceae bacterium]